MITIYVDADACPVKPEVMRVAMRCGLKVLFVANSWMRLPAEWKAELRVVEGNFDAADNWIIERVVKNDIVVTADIPLAHRAIQAGAKAIGVKGNLYTEENIGDILATRNLMDLLRGGGENLGGPAPFQKEDRSKFLQGLDQIIQAIKNDRPRFR